MKAFRLPLAAVWMLKLDISNYLCRPWMLQDNPPFSAPRHCAHYLRGIHSKQPRSDTVQTEMYSRLRIAQPQSDTNMGPDKASGHTSTAVDTDEMWLAGLSFCLCCWLSHPVYQKLFLARLWLDILRDISLTSKCSLSICTYWAGLQTILWKQPHIGPWNGSVCNKIRALPQTSHLNKENGTNSYKQRTHLTHPSMILQKKRHHVCRLTTVFTKVDYNTTVCYSKFTGNR